MHCSDLAGWLLHVACFSTVSYMWLGFARQLTALRLALLEGSAQIHLSVWRDNINK